jgi:hypothetical protein
MIAIAVRAKTDIGKSLLRSADARMPHVRFLQLKSFFVIYETCEAIQIAGGLEI